MKGFWIESCIAVVYLPLFFLLWTSEFGCRENITMSFTWDMRRCRLHSSVWRGWFLSVWTVLCYSFHQWQTSYFNATIYPSEYDQSPMIKAPLYLCFTSQDSSGTLLIGTTEDWWVDGWRAQCDGRHFTETVMAAIVVGVFREWWLRR